MSFPAVNFSLISSLFISNIESDLDSLIKWWSSRVGLLSPTFNNKIAESDCQSNSTLSAS